MIYKKLKEQIISEYDYYLDNSGEENPEVLVDTFFTIIETRLDNDILNQEEDDIVAFARMMGEVLQEVPDLLYYGMGDQFDELIANKEDCLAYVFSTALISYTVRDLVLYYNKEGLFTDELLVVLGVTEEFLQQPENPYTLKADDTDFDLNAFKGDPKNLH